MATESRGNPKYWFAKKRGLGYGCGMPIAWQGWVVYGIAALVMVGGYFLFEHPGDDEIYGLFIIVTVLVLLVVCMIKGEPLS